MKGSAMVIEIMKTNECQSLPMALKTKIYSFSYVLIIDILTGPEVRLLILWFILILWFDL